MSKDNTNLNSKSFFIYGGILALAGLTNAANYWGGIFFFDEPHNLGIALGTIDSILLAVVTVEIARAFRRIELRLQKLEHLNIIRSEP